MERLLKKWIETYFRALLGRYYVLVTISSFVISALAVWVIATSWNINSDFKELLPQTSAAAQAMEEVGERVGSGSSLFVVIDSPNQEKNLEFAHLYADKLREIPQVALAHFHNDKSFFEQHRLLYLDREDLVTLYDRIRHRIRQEKQQANPLFVPLRTETRGDNSIIETSDIEQRFEELAHQDYKEYLISDDGYSLTIVVRFVEASTDLAATNRLLDHVREVGEKLEPSTFHPQMRLEFGGGLVHRQQEYSSIVDDIQTSAIFTILGLLLVISLYFRRFRAVALILVPLIMGILWTLALAFSFFGELTTVTVFIFVILLGLGIDFSIHLLNGYDFERFKGSDPVEALIRCYNSVGRATTIGATTTFATFVVLSFAQFRGLSQFGQVASIGVLCTLSAMLTTLPALILSFHRLLPHKPSQRYRLASLLRTDRWLTSESVSKASPFLLALAATLTIFSAFSIGNLTFEENFRRIGQVETPWSRSDNNDAPQLLATTKRNARRAANHVQRTAISTREAINPDSFVQDRKQLTTGAKYTSALSGQHSSTPTLLLLDDAEETATVYRHMASMHRDGRLPSVRSVASIHAFLPGTMEEQFERLEEIERIQELLERENLSSFSSEVQDQLKEFQDLLDVEPISIYDLPDWTKRLFREAGPQARPPAESEDFAFEYLIYVNEAIDHMVGDQARRFLGEVHQVTVETGLPVRIGSQSYIYIAMLDEIKEDGAVMLGVALIIVFILLMVFFRSPFRAVITLVPLGVGALWMFGFCGWIGIKLDFFNVIILPVVIGIGIDDGVHFYHRYLELGKGFIREVIHQVGSAVGMTSITSMIGFGGLAVTNYAGLQSIGYLAIVGIASAFLATVLLLPALLWFAEKFHIRHILPAHAVTPDNDQATIH